MAQLIRGINRQPYPHINTVKRDRFGPSNPYVGKILGIDGKYVDSSPGRFQPAWLPLTGASLDLDFVADRYFGAMKSDISITRNSPGMAQRLDGSWVEFAANVLRITDIGLLVEEARTNAIRNNTMQGAVAGNPGTLPTNWSSYLAPAGLTRQVVGVGSTGNIEWVDVRVTGTAATSGEISFYPEGTNMLLFPAATAMTSSMFLALVAGSVSGLSSFSLRGLSYNGATYVTEGATAVPLTNLLSRFRHSYTTAAGSDRTIAPITANAQAGSVIDFTLRIGLPQLEQGSFPTSPIKTSGAAAMRAADAITRPWSLAAPFTVYAETLVDSLLGSRTAWQVDVSGSGNDRVLKRVAPTNFQVFGVTGGATVGDINMGAAASAGVIMKGADAIADNDWAGSKNGEPVVTDATGLVASGLNTFRLGSEGSGTFLNGYLRRLAVFPSRLPNAQLQSLTT